MGSEFCLAAVMIYMTDQIGDMGIEVEGPSVHQLFRRAGLALLSLTTNIAGRG